MPSILSDPKSILVLCLVIGFVIGVNLTLFGWLRGDRRVQAEAAKWTKAFGGGGTARRAQTDQLAELHQAVARLRASKPDDEPPPGNGA
jgi:hypothetical protein